MNEKDKIIEILFSEIKSTKISCNEENACERCLFPCESKRIAEQCADALIATGIGDVAEWKAKYEKMSLVTKLYTNACTTEIERLTKERDGLKHRAELWEKHCKDWETLVKERERMAEVAERALEYAVSEYRCDECPCIECNAEIRGSLECIDLIAKTYRKQAERDIEEEKNNGKK